MMMLASSMRSAAAAASRACGARMLGTALPTVADVTVHVNFVDTDGNRTRVPARVGQTLYEAAKLNNVDMDGDDSTNNPYSARRTPVWTEDLFGEGPSNAQDHVILESNWYNKVPPPMPEEVTVLEDKVYFGDLTGQSRLGSQIYLDKSLDEIVVHLVDVPPSDIP